MRGALQTLALMLPAPEAGEEGGGGGGSNGSGSGTGSGGDAADVPPGRRRAVAAELHDEVRAVTAKQAMARACLEALGTRELRVDAAGDADLAAALAALSLRRRRAGDDGNGDGDGDGGGGGGSDRMAAAAMATNAGAAAPRPSSDSRGGGGGSDDPTWRGHVERLEAQLAAIGCDVVAGAVAPAPPVEPDRMRRAVGDDGDESGAVEGAGAVEVAAEAVAGARC